MCVEKITQMGGWQQYLTNSTLPLKQRLQGAQVAFFSSSAELSTHQKEDVVIQWLIRLVKEKEASTWQEDVCQEQEAVWQLISAVFSSKRLQVLVSHRWTCPITSSFPQSIINVLGSGDLSPITQKCIVDTLHSILHTPALSSVITNSGSLSLNLTTRLLDLANAMDWTVVTSTVARTRAEVKATSAGEGGQPWIKRVKLDHQLEKKKLEGDVSAEVDPVFSVHIISDSELTDEEKVLHALTLLLGDVKLQMLAKGVDAMAICSHQLLKRVGALKVALNPYNENLKSRVMKQLEALVTCCLFSAEVFPQYELFLSQLMLEDSKVGQEQSALHIVLSMFSDVISHEPVPVVRCVTNLFMRGFLDRCGKDDHILKMFVTLLYIAGISIPGDYFIDPNNLLVSLIDKKEISTERKEAVLASIMKVLLTSKASVRAAPSVQTYIKTLLIHLSNHHQPTTADGFLAFRQILSMYFSRLLDDLPPVLGRLLTWDKPTEEAKQVYEEMLVGLVNISFKVNKMDAFVVNLIKAIAFSKNDLKSHEQLSPSIDPDQRGGTSTSMLPPRFLSKLASTLKNLEPKQFCSLLKLLLDTMKTVVLPLAQVSSNGLVDVTNWRAVTTSSLLAGAIVAGGTHHRAVRIEGRAAVLVASVKEYLDGLLRPLLEALLSSQHDNGGCCGVLMLSQAWNHWHHVLLRSQSTYRAEWHATLPPTEDDDTSVLVPHTSAKIWNQLKERLEEHGDTHDRTQFLRLLLQRLSHMTEENARLQVKEATPSSTSKSSQIAPALPKLLMELLQQWPKEACTLMLCQRPMLLLVLPVAVYHKKLAQIMLDNYATYADTWRKVLQEDSPQSSFYPQTVSVVLSELVGCIKQDSTATEQTKKRKRQSEGDGEVITQFGALLQEICKNVDKFAEDDQGNFTKKHFDAKSAKCGKSLIAFIEMLNNGETQPAISYKSREKVRNLLLLLNDIPVNSSSSKQRVFLMMALLACFFNTDLSKNKLDSITELMLGIVNQCMGSGLQMMFTKTLDLPCLINRVVVLQQTLPPDTVEDVVTSTDRAPLVLQVNTFMRSLCYQLVHAIYKVESVQNVSSFITNSAKQACTEQGADEEEKFLRPAWALVLACSQSLEDKNNLSSERLRWCKKTVRSIGSWCVRLLHRLDLRTVTGITAAHGLAIYTALVRVEVPESETTSDETTPSVADQDKSLANKFAARVVTPGWAESDADSLNQTANGLDDTLNTTFDGGESGGKSKRWQRYMDDGVQLAKVCLTSELPALEAAAMCFIIALKMLPTAIQQQLPQDMFRFALRFFTKAPSDKTKYIDSYIQADPDQLTELTAVKPIVLKDLVTERPISLNTLLADCPLDVYQGLLDDLQSRTIKLDDGLFPHTSALWSVIINTPVDDLKTRAKRSSLTVLARTLVWHLSLARASQTVTEEKSVAFGLKGSVMVYLLELFQTILKSQHSLPHHTTLQTVSAASVSTDHLPLLHFVKVWQCQVSLLDVALLVRVTAWPDRVAGLLAAVQILFEQLVIRSDQDDPIALANKEALTGCCLCLERLVRRLESLGEALAPVVHHTLGAMVTALHHTIVIAPVKSVLDQQVYQLFRLCERNCLEHLLVALPEETRPLLQHYHHNYHKYYAFKKRKE